MDVQAVFWDSLRRDSPQPRDYEYANDPYDVLKPPKVRSWLENYFEPRGRARID